MTVLLRLCLWALLALAPAAVARADANLEAGVPALSRPWQGADYDRLAGLIRAGKVALPSYGDPSGALLLARLTSLENLIFTQRQGRLAKFRLSDSAGIMAGTGDVLQIYHERTPWGDKAPPREVAQLAGYMLHACRVVVINMAEVFPALPAGKERESALSILQALRKDTVATLAQVERALHWRNTFSPSDMSVLIEAMHASLPTLKELLPADVRTELGIKLTEDLREFRGGQDGQRIEEMIEELKRPGSPAPAPVISPPSRSLRRSSRIRSPCLAWCRSRP